MKKFLQEFKEFISKGNVLDMAVGIIIGSAFTSIVDSLVSDLISPLLGLFGTQNLDAMSVVIKQGATEEETVTLNYGSFLSAVINFIIMAFILFCIIKLFSASQEEMKKLKHEEEVEEKPTTKMCPYCRSTDVPIEATRCPHCTSQLVVEGVTEEQADGKKEQS